MATRTFKTEDLREIAWGGCADGIEHVENWTGDKWRWGTWEHVIFKDLTDGRFFQLDYQEGSGDSDCEFLDGVDEYEAEEVERHEVVKVTVEWKLVPA
jgi:hypothetical protein